MNARDLENKIREASKDTGKIMVDTKRYLKKTAGHRVVHWKDGVPWVRIAGMDFEVKGYDNLNRKLGVKNMRPVYLFYVY